MVFCFISKQIKKNFSLDLRSLALFRVLVSSLLITDFLFTRLPYFTLFYTDKGVLPLATIPYTDVNSSLNFVSANSGYQMTLFILAVLCFFMLLVGYKTKSAIFGAWILYISFRSRNYLIWNAGIIVMILMLFWSLCLPLSRYFSIDSSFTKDNQKRQTTRVFSVNSFAFISQILLIYYFAYLHKTGELWKSGQALYYILMMDEFRTPWGDILLQYPSIMQALTQLTLYIECLIPILFILFGFWWPLRMAIIFIMCGFHLSMELFLHTGFFQYICIIGWMAFLPGEFWEKIKTITLRKKNHPLRVYFDGQCSFCKKSIALIKTFLILPPHVSFLEAQSHQKALLEMEKRNSWLVTQNQTEYQDRWSAVITLLSYSPLFFYLAPLLRGKIFSVPGNWLYKKVASNRQKVGHFLPDFKQQEQRTNRVFSILLSVFFLFCFIYVLVANVITTNFEHYSKHIPPKKWDQIGAFLHLHQSWNMFAPNPPADTGWIILSATKSNGNKTEKIDLWKQGKPVSMEKPQRYDMTFPVFRFRVLIEALAYSYPQHYTAYLTYLCNKWNEKLTPKKERIQNVEFIHMKQTIPPFGTKFPKPETIILHNQVCP